MKKKAIRITLSVIGLSVLSVALFHGALEVGAFFYDKWYEKNYEGWQLVELDSGETLRLPENWIFEENDDIMQIKDENGKLMFVEAQNLYNDKKDSSYINYNGTDYDFSVLTSSVYSNSAISGEASLTSENESTKCYFFEIYVSTGEEENITYFLSTDASVNEEMVEEIAKSYNMD